MPFGHPFPSFELMDGSRLVNSDFVTSYRRYAIDYPATHPGAARSAAATDPEGVSDAGVVRAVRPPTSTSLLIAYFNRPTKAAKNFC